MIFLGIKYEPPTSVGPPPSPTPLSLKFVSEAPGYRGYYTVSKRYGFYLRVAKISHELSATKRVRCFVHEKIKSISFGNGVMFFLLYGHRTSFYDFLKSSENLLKSSEVFGNSRKFSENFGNGSKVIFRCFYDF